MDPVSLVVAALSAGAAAAAKDTAAQVVKDAYEALKALVKRKVAGDPGAAEALDRHEDSPAVWDKRLRQALDAPDRVDNQVVVSAQRLLALLDAAGSRQGKYQVTVTGGKGTVIGDHAHVEMTFEGGDE
jgi:hypothetical protein